MREGRGEATHTEGFRLREESRASLRSPWRAGTIKTTGATGFGSSCGAAVSFAAPLPSLGLRALRPLRRRLVLWRFRIQLDLDKLLLLRLRRAPARVVKLRARSRSPLARKRTAAVAAKAAEPEPEFITVNVEADPPKRPKKKATSRPSSPNRRLLWHLVCEKGKPACLGLPLLPLRQGCLLLN